jgi:hypothetical protein
VKEHLITAANVDPQHYLLLTNAANAKAWFESGGLASNQPLRLECRHDFQLFERTLQPALPGPLPSDWEIWEEAASVASPEIKPVLSGKSLSILSS